MYFPYDTLLYKSRVFYKSFQHKRFKAYSNNHMLSGNVCSFESTMCTKLFLLSTLLTGTIGVFIACQNHKKIFEEMKDFIQVVSSSKEATITSAERRKLIPAYSPPKVTNFKLIPDGFQLIVPGTAGLHVTLVYLSY